MNKADDPLNALLLSDKIEDILSFYNFFEDRDSLITWMRNRTKSDPSLIDIQGDATAVVVIPTADYNSKRTLNCSNDIYKGMQQVIVESRKPWDLYFNYSHNVNAGLKRAMELNPDWIIISNDDMVKVDPSLTLLKELKLKDHGKYNALFTEQHGTYHSFPRFIGTPNLLYSLVTYIHPNRYRKRRQEIWNKFGLKYLEAIDTGSTGIMSRLTYKVMKEHLLTGSFTILSRNYVESVERVLDETFINGGEDADLSLKLAAGMEKIGFIQYNIGDLIGTSLGSGWTRYLRNVVNEVYLSYKIEKGLTPLQ